MTTTPERQLEIDELVQKAGYRFNPTTQRFEGAIGSAPVNEDEIHAESFCASRLSSVTVAELADYIRWKTAQMDARHAVGIDTFPREPAEA